MKAGTCLRCKKTWRERFDTIASNHQGKYDEMLVRVDKPIVDYISVYDQGEDLKRKGVALEMYRHGALWLAQRGLILHASGLQQPEAALSWASMERQGMIAHYNDGQRDRRFIDTSKFV